jgi:hypothetical protein
MLDHDESILLKGGGFWRHTVARFWRVTPYLLNVFALT